MKWDWFGFNDSRPRIMHNDSNTQVIQDIAAKTIFIRESDGATIIEGSIGPECKLSTLDRSKLIIKGPIRANCQIYIDDNSKVLFEGQNIPSDLKIEIRGQSQVNFLHQPPANVIHSIKFGPGSAKAFCGENELTRPNQGYTLHHLSTPSSTSAQNFFGPVAPPQPRVIYVEKPIANTATKPTDLLSELTQSYIESYSANHPCSIAKCIEDLKLTADEEVLFKQFRDPITFDYFDDIPISYDEKYWNYCTLLQIYEDKPINPFNRLPMKRSDFQPARNLLNEFDKIVKNLKKQRAQNSVENQLAGLENNFSNLSM